MSDVRDQEVLEETLHQSWDNVLTAELARARVQELIEEAQAIQKSVRRRTRISNALSIFAIGVVMLHLAWRIFS